MKKMENTDDNSNSNDIPCQESDSINANFIRKSYKFLIEYNNLDYVKKSLDDFKFIKIKIDENNPVNQKVSSIYFDNDIYLSYNNRILKNPDAMCIRLRTYNNDLNIFFAECKIHKGYTSLNSIKERIKLDTRDIYNLLNNRDDYYLKKSTIYDKINYNIINKNFKPKISVVYNRTAYSYDDIRLTLDSDLYAYETDNLDNIMSENLTNIDTFRFKYAILELKIKNNQSYMDINIIKKLINDKILIQVPEFSKYLSCLYYFKANELNIKPYWYDDFINEIHNTKIYKNLLEKPIQNLNNLVIPISLKPNTFTSIESLYYKIFNLIIGIPFLLSQYDKITNHSSLLLNPFILKYYIIICLFVNMITYIQINNGLINRTLNYIGTIFPILLGLIMILSILL